MERLLNTSGTRRSDTTKFDLGVISNPRNMSSNMISFCTIQSIQECLAPLSKVTHDNLQA